MSEMQTDPSGSVQAMNLHTTKSNKHTHRHTHTDTHTQTFTQHSHLTSKRLFMFMLKICMRRLAAAVTKSIAGGSSWKWHTDHEKNSSAQHLDILVPSITTIKLHLFYALIRITMLCTSVVLSSQRLSVCVCVCVYTSVTLSHSNSSHVLFAKAVLRGGLCVRKVKVYYLVPHKFCAISFLLEVFSECLDTAAEHLGVTLNPKHLLVLQSAHTHCLWRACWMHIHTR